MKRENVLSQESAETEFEKFCDYYDIDFDEETSEDGDDESKAASRAMKAFRKKMIKGLQRGRISFAEENGFQIVQKCRDTQGNDQEIKYREIDGAAKTAMSQKKEHDHMGKCYALLGSLCGLGEGAIKKLRGPDLSLAEAIGGILLLA